MSLILPERQNLTLVEDGNIVTKVLDVAHLMAGEGTFSPSSISSRTTSLSSMALTGQGRRIVRPG